MNTKFIFRGFLFALIALVFIAAAGVIVISGFFASPPNGPAPPSARITAPEGDIPSEPVGLEEWAKYQGEEIELVGSGFLLGLSADEIIAVTTAHSLTLGNADRTLEQIAFGIAGELDFLLEMDTLYGAPGKPRRGRDMTVDYVFLELDGAVEPAHVLQPDPRGEPVPGERVTLYSGLGGGDGQPQKLDGTVHTVNKSGFWVLMDDDFNPGRMSGSPFVSVHTGKVVGMAISAAYNDQGLMIGVHPIDSVVAKAEAAEGRFMLREFQR